MVKLPFELSFKSDLNVTIIQSRDMSFMSRIVSIESHFILVCFFFSFNFFSILKRNK